MTQISRPTAQHTDNYPDGDSGPYSSLQWRTVFKTMFTTDDDQGPIGGYLNELEVTNPIDKTIRVASGGAVVGGNIFFNDANVNFSPPNPAGAARYDYVVACLNDTNTVMTVSDAGHTLAFPTDLTDYNSASSIQEYASRLVIVRGAEGGGLPTLDQNDDHYMIPLASYLITTAGAVSSFTDRRNRVRRRTFFVPALKGYNWDTTTEIDPTTFNRGTSLAPGTEAGVGIQLPDAQHSYAIGQFIVPEDYASDMVIQAIALAEGNGAVDVQSRVRFGPCGAGWSLSDTAAGIETVSEDSFECLQEMANSYDIAEYWASVWTARDGNDASDTLTQAFYIVGWRVDYSAGL